MPECEHCGEALTNLAFDCNYCGQVNCTSHRLPEAHDCVALHLALPPGHARSDSGDVVVGDLDTEGMRARVRKEAPGASAERIDTIVDNVESELDEPSEKPYDVFEPELTVGTPDEIVYESSPDLNTDGSLAGAEEEVDARGDSAGSSRGTYILLLVLGLIVGYGLYLIL